MSAGRETQQPNLSPSHQCLNPLFEAIAGWAESIEALTVETLLRDSHPSLERGTPTFDAGLAILATLARDPSASERGLARWIEDADRVAYSGALFGGFGGLLAGAALANRRFPSLANLTTSLVQTVSDLAVAPEWLAEGRAWHHYDLISGPSGSMLALIVAGASSAHVAPLAHYLAARIEEPDLQQLRIDAYQRDALRYWNTGRINTGLAHGTGGIALALSAAAETYPDLRDDLVAPLQRIADWMIGEAFEDTSGLLTWTPAAREGRAPPPIPARREAWCYGSPGLAWVLYEIGRVLDEDEICRFACSAMSSFCRAFDERRFVDVAPISDALAICHGVAGMLALADAFSHHTNHAAATDLAEHLEALLLMRLDDVRLLASENQTLLSGASGVLAVLLTRAGGNRDWLRTIGLR